MTILMKGSMGEAVKELQIRLQEMGFGPRWADGIFGLDTEKAVIAYQKERGLPPDGVAGGQFVYALNSPNSKLDTELLGLLRLGASTWNEWRHEHATIAHPNLELANLQGWNLEGANLREANLGGATLIQANLTEADLRGANLNSANMNSTQLFKANLEGADLSNTNCFEIGCSNANLKNTNLSGAMLIGANLKEADLRGANLSDTLMLKAQVSAADLSGANLSNATLSASELHSTKLVNATLIGADLSRSVLIETNFENANLSGCSVYGIAAWNLNLQGAIQSDLVITDKLADEATITVDDLEVGQFIYLLLNRKKLRNVLDTITSKAVLLLGRFTPERKAILDALADELRKHNLLPIIFDFERSTNRDFTETIKILAGLSLFVIVDLTKPKSAPQEVTATVPDYQIPFVPILEEGEDPYSMFGDLMKYDWMLKPLLKYRTKEVLLANFKNAILDRAWKKHLELQRKKNEELEIISIDQVIG